MSIKRIFIAISAIFAASAVFADNSSVTSKKYVDDLMSGYQGKLPGSGANTLMIYDDETGIGEKSIETTLGENATGVPTVGAVKTGLDGKQDTITGTAGYVMTGTGNAGEVGEKPIYSANTNYTDSLVTAETVNTGVINAVNSSLIRVDENGDQDPNGILWEIQDNLVAINANVPYGYTELQYVVFDGTQVLDTGFAPNQDTKIVSKFNGTTSAAWVYGAGSSNPRVTCYLAPTGNQRFGNVTVANTGIDVNTINVVTQNKNGFDVNGNLTAYSDVGNFTVKKTITIGKANGVSGSTAYFSGNFYYMKIYDNGTLVRDYVPAIDSNNTVGFWDKVSGTFTTPSTGILANGPVVGN